MNSKKCTKCKNDKLIEANFRKDKKYADGFTSWCTLCLKSYRHNHYLKNKEKTARQQREYIKNNVDRRYKITSEYNRKNREKFKKWKSAWRAKVKDDPAYKLGHAISNNLRHALKTKKNGRHWETLVGYTVEDLIHHITGLLTDGMTWDNYGPYWHLDHVTPKSWFKYSDTNDPQFKACWALSNLQPMLAVDNMKKRNLWTG